MKTMHKITKVYIIFLTACLLFSTQSNAQKNDYVWLTGIGENKAVIDFNGEVVIMEESPLSLPIQGDNASYCTDDGELVFYTNGFAVANANHEIYANGDSLNTGKNYFVNGDQEKYGRIGMQDIIILPEPYSDSSFYIFHLPIFFDDENEIRAGSLLYSYLDLKANNGNGEIVEKNVEFHYEEFILTSYLTAMQVKDSEDWWIIYLKEYENIYYTFRLDSMGINLVHDQDFGGERFYNASAGGTAKFSPDGTKYTHFNYGDQLSIFDFDRESGKLSNFKKVIVNDTLPMVFTSVEWSPNSRFIYVACSFYLYQIDTWNDNEVTLISIWSGLSDPFPNYYWLMVQGPDCRIYVRSTNGTDSWHVIHYPDEKGEACGFQEAGVRPPNKGSFGNWPNHPRWRVDAEEKCDPSIVTMLGKPIYYVEEMKVYPNPAHDFVNLEIPTGVEGDVELYSVDGQLVKKVYRATEENIMLDVSDLQSGIYFIEFLPSENPERKIYQSRLVKE